MQNLNLTFPEKVDTPDQRILKEIVHMSPKPRRYFIPEQKAEVVRIVCKSFLAIQ